MAQVTIVESIAAAVTHIIDEAGSHIRVAMPLGIGKPNPLINALYKRIQNNPAIRLDIFTALSLLKPTPKSTLERRFLEPFLARLYGDYPDLEYARALQTKTLPNHIRVHEFFMQAGAWLNNIEMQQNYISSNYTHIARDMMAQNVNVVMQTVAARTENGVLTLSLASNPEVTLEIMERIERARASSQKVLTVGVINEAMPFMSGTAEVPPDFFDLLVNAPAASHTLFCTPNMKVSTADYAIGLHASSFVRDGGTLQIGIGSLGDAIAQSLIVRQRNNAGYQALLHKLNHQQKLTRVQSELFAEGLYGCSEMFVNGLLELIEAGIIKRAVQDKNGKNHIMHGGFFIGPRSFYQALRDMPAEKMAKIDMQRIDFLNQLYGDEELKRAQRQKASFVNSCMMVTLSGAAVSDALEDGRMVSGVGGQYNFVAMAHALPDAHSILMLRSFRMSHGRAQSNIVKQYGGCTIPHHLRDIVITEYGVAQLRGKSNSEVIAALINIADSRFQEDLRAWAVAHEQLPADYCIPAQYRNNTPSVLAEKLQAYQQDFPDFPFGHDFSDEELVIIGALEKLKSASAHPLTLASFIFKNALKNSTIPEAYLRRMGFTGSGTLKEKLLQKLFVAAFN